MNQIQDLKILYQIVLQSRFQDPYLFIIKSGQFASHVSFLQQFLDDPNPVDDNGTTPLHLAAKHGHLSIIKVFSKSSIAENSINHSGFTPLHYSAENGHFQGINDF